MDDNATTGIKDIIEAVVALLQWESALQTDKRPAHDLTQVSLALSRTQTHRWAAVQAAVDASCYLRLRVVGLVEFCLATKVCAWMRNHVDVCPPTRT